MRKSLLLVPLLALMGCDHLIDCAIMNRRAEMKNKAEQHVRRADYVTIVYAAEVTNDPLDDEDYVYSFDIDGPLPQGLEPSFNGRHVVLRGYAEKIGVYDFTISVHVDYVGEEDKCLKSDDDRNRYRIRVE